MSAKVADDEDIPQELVENFEGFRTALDHVEEVMKQLVDTQRTKILNDFTPLEVAKLDLVSAYSINSLFWMYLITQGINPRQHEIKRELERIKSYMGKVKEIEDRGKAPKLQKEAAKRFVRNAMFDLEDKNKQKKAEDNEHSDEKGSEEVNEKTESSLHARDKEKIEERGKLQKHEKASKNDRKRHHGHNTHKQSKRGRTESGKKKWHHRKKEE